MPGKTAREKDSDAGFGLLSWAERQAKREAAQKAKKKTTLSPSAFKPQVFGDLEANRVM